VLASTDSATLRIIPALEGAHGLVRAAALEGLAKVLPAFQAREEIAQ